MTTKQTAYPRRDSDDPRAAFERFIAEHGLTMSAVSVPFRPDRSDDWSKGALHFAVTINKGKVAIWSGFYSVGSAHPEMWAKTKGARFYGEMKAVRSYPRTLKGEAARQRIREAYVRAAPLNPADILESLQRDAQAINAGNFEVWADEIGCDKDSRSAEATYRACLEVAHRLQQGLGRQGFREFMGLATEDAGEGESA